MRATPHHSAADAIDAVDVVDGGWQLCDAGRMTPSISETLIATAVIMSCVVFTIAFRIARRAAGTAAHGMDAELPRAALLTAPALRPRAGFKPWLIATMPAIQAGMVAAGVTGIFIMLLCMAGVMGLAIFAMG